MQRAPLPASTINTQPNPAAQVAPNPTAIAGQRGMSTTQQAVAQLAAAQQAAGVVAPVQSAQPVAPAAPATPEAAGAAMAQQAAPQGPVPGFIPNSNGEVVYDQGKGPVTEDVLPLKTAGLRLKSTSEAAKDATAKAFIDRCFAAGCSLEQTKLAAEKAAALGGKFPLTWKLCEKLGSDDVEGSDPAEREKIAGFGRLLQGLFQRSLTGASRVGRNGASRSWWSNWWRGGGRNPSPWTGQNNLPRPRPRPTPRPTPVRKNKRGLFGSGAGSGAAIGAWEGIDSALSDNPDFDFTSWKDWKDALPRVGGGVAAGALGGRALGRFAPRVGRSAAKNYYRGYWADTITDMATGYDPHLRYFGPAIGGAASTSALRKVLSPRLAKGIGKAVLPTSIVGGAAVAPFKDMLFTPPMEELTAKWSGLLGPGWESATDEQKSQQLNEAARPYAEHMSEEYWSKSPEDKLAEINYRAAAMGVKPEQIVAMSKPENRFFAGLANLSPEVKAVIAAGLVTALAGFAGGNKALGGMGLLLAAGGAFPAIRGAMPAGPGLAESKYMAQQKMLQQAQAVGQMGLDAQQAVRENPWTSPALNNPVTNVLFPGGGALATGLLNTDFTKGVSGAAQEAPKDPTFWQNAAYPLYSNGQWQTPSWPQLPN